MIGVAPIDEGLIVVPRCWGVSMNKHQITLGSAVALLALLILMHPASADTFKWANDGDVRAMDPYTLNETVQNSSSTIFTSGWFSATSSWASSLRSRSVGNRRARQFGASICARMSNGKTAARSPPTMSPSPISASAEELGQALASEHDQGGAQDR